MKKILGDAKSVRQLLKGNKYSVDYYQREYKWEGKQLAELIADLTTKFLESYEPGQERSAVEHYGHYFLGSIIISEKEGQRFIVDGQQRMTTLTLLLIYLHNLQRDRAEKVAVDELIFSERYGRRSFNLDVSDRNACMEALFTNGPFDAADQNPSVQNITARYTEFDELLPDELQSDALPFFIDWLIENVHLVEITAFSDDDAYTIFETMNDRGLSLTPTDMLKGFLLANISDEKRRLAANATWKARVNDLNQLGKEEDADCIKAWLRSQHAETIRERKRGALPQDFDRIGTEFHRWVREFRDRLNLKNGSDYARFIESDFSFYSKLYKRIRETSETLTPSLPSIFYNAQHNFTLQYPLLLAPVRVSDPEPVVLRKLQIVSDFIDILIARRIWNFRAIDYSTMQYAMFLVMKEIRGLGVEELAAALTERLHGIEDEAPAFSENFYLHGTNGKQIHRLLARMTDYVETRSGQASRYREYSIRGRGGYEVEHIWADHPARHKDEFENPSDFDAYRNRIGGLLLLPKSFNASYGDLPYEDKRPHYLSQNLLARSLHDQCYQHNPGFVRMVTESGLPFRAHAAFKRADLDERQNLYMKLAERVWSPARLTGESANVQ